MSVCPCVRFTVKMYVRNLLRTVLFKKGTKQGLLLMVCLNERLRTVEYRLGDLDTFCIRVSVCPSPSLSVRPKLLTTLLYRNRMT